VKASSIDIDESTAWWAAFDDPERYLDERDVLEPGESAPDPEPQPERDARSAAEAHTHAASVLEGVTVRARALTAQQYAGIAEVLRDAAEHPEPWVGPDPTLQPDWSDPRDRTAAQVRRERQDIAVRAAAADLAVRLRFSESMVRTRGAYSETLRARCPLVWDAFLSGSVIEQNAVTVAQLAMTLPHDDPESWSAFDGAIDKAASSLPPGKFRIRARVVRERVHRESIDDRHRRAVADRAVWVTPELDGMASMTWFGPAVEAVSAYSRIDAHARHLRDQDGEQRTLAQLRSDVLRDLLLSGTSDLLPRGEGRASLAITIPVLTMLGEGDEPATLGGYGPIDIETAKRLAGEAASWVRILTHPVTGTVLDVDRKTHRVPKALRRWLDARDPVCIFAGCTRPAKECQIDHRVEWQYGGTTADTNLAPLCEPHHVIKTKSNWELYRDTATGASWWVTPTALKVEPDPPPW
jgi:hypothetical protein